MANSDKPAPKRRRKPASPSPGGGPPANGEDATVEPARREKIARLKQAIEEGTYQVSSDEVARKVIEHMFQPKK